MGEATTPEFVVRVRCACGQRVRVKNARAGAIVQCPRCARSIQLTNADLRAASAGIALQPMQADIAQAPDAIPLGDERLRLARTGSRPGATGEVIETPDELARDLLKVGASRALRRTAGGCLASPETYAGVPRSELLRRFTAEVAAGVVLGGRLGNLWTLLATTGGALVPLAVSTWLNSVAAWGFAIWPLAFSVAFLNLLTVGVVLHFWATTLTHTATGEDDIPIFTSEGDSTWDVRPPLTILLSALIPFGPVGCLWVTYGTAVPQFYATVALLVLGSALWPLALLSQVAFSSPTLLVPHRLVRTLRDLGAAYLVAWAVEVVALVAVVGPLVLRARWTFGLPPSLLTDALLLLNAMYAGYVHFRTIGLLYRCYAHRLPS